jgi:hypothetical protein
MNRLLGFGGILTVVGGLFLLILPVSHIPLLDANRWVLSETEQQGYCAGYVFDGNEPQEQAAADCRSESSQSTEIDLRVVQRAACQGYASAHSLDATWVNDCEGYLQATRQWPTIDGRLTDAWNRRFPYPLSDIGIPGAPTSESRTGDREGNTREGLPR